MCVVRGGLSLSPLSSLFLPPVFFRFLPVSSFSLPSSALLSRFLSCASYHRCFRPFRMALSFMWGPDSSSQAVFSMGRTREFSVPVELSNPAEGDSAHITYYIKPDLHRQVQKGNQNR